MTADASPWVLSLADPAAQSVAVAGGKGASLARLLAAGLPVPSGFCITTEAYRRVAEGIAAEPTKIEAATIPPEIMEEVVAAYSAMGQVAVAVRSSSTSEDQSGASFAGQHDTVLDVRGVDAVIRAIRRCWASLWTPRAIEYRRRVGDTGRPSIAVVVQELVIADSAGVLFTADPTSGEKSKIHINASWGLGESIVSGRVTPDALVVDRATLAVVDERIGDKAVMTSVTGDGTVERPVPADLRRSPVLSPDRIAELCNIAIGVEKLQGEPVDVEWALQGDRAFLLQARPLTAPAFEEWNDSLRGDFLWSSGNLGEAIPDVMTPSTWSVLQRFMPETMATSSVPEFIAYGNIGGRFYMNLSVAASLAAAFGLKKKFLEASQEVFGKIPEGVEVPLAGLSRWRTLRKLAPIAFSVVRRARKNLRAFATFDEAAAQRSEALRSKIAGSTNAGALAGLWRSDLDPFFCESCHMLEAVTREAGGALVDIRLELKKLVGASDAELLLTGLHGGSEALASLGLLVGLRRLERGELGRADFEREFGHRGPHEFEISTPRPAEDAQWVDAQVRDLRRAKTDVDDLLARQATQRRAAWDRLEESQPRKVASIRRRTERWAKIARNREAARSHMMRAFWVVRAFYLRASVVLDCGDDVFFAHLDELVAVLDGAPWPRSAVRGRRAAYRRYRALPCYPTIIRGRFDPVSWAADPRRRHDVFSPGIGEAQPSDTIKGFAGAGGVVEGRARVLAEPEQGHLLEEGEVLVTVVTNVGWTPLFPRAAAIVTDVGAPLSHAAIVARELGIPAVVGCGDATMRISTGDRIRVDGLRGEVHKL